MPRPRALAAVALAAAALLGGAPARAASVTPTRTASATVTGSPTRLPPSYVPGGISTVAGNGVAGYRGDGGAATAADVHRPGSVRFDHDGNMFIVQRYDNRVRRVAAGTGVITTVAGDGVPGFSGDGGAATSARLNWPQHIDLDPFGNLFIAEINNNRVRRVAASTGIITTVAGNGLPGFSGDGGAATTASLNGPHGVCFDLDGNLFVADSGNHRVRKVAAGTGIISTVVGNGVWGFSGDGGAATSASIAGSYSIAFDSSGNLFIADSYNFRVRIVSVSGVITTVAGSAVPAAPAVPQPAHV